MKLHANCRSCPKSRRLLVKRVDEEGWSLRAAAEAAALSERSARKWLGRWRVEGEAGLLDRSSAPKRVPSRLPADRLKAIEALRRLRMAAAEIAEVLSMALSTVSRWLKRIGLGKCSRLTPPEPCEELPGARGAPPAHPPLSPSDQWEGRALHPDSHQSLGLRSDLWFLGGAHRSPVWLARSLQLQETTRLPWPSTARSPVRRAGTTC
jgi:transposase